MDGQRRFGRSLATRTVMMHDLCELRLSQSLLLAQLCKPVGDHLRFTTFARGLDSFLSDMSTIDCRFAHVFQVSGYVTHFPSRVRLEAIACRGHRRGQCSSRTTVFGADLVPTNQRYCLVLKINDKQDADFACARGPRAVPLCCGGLNP